jgi:hypothetical protein
VAQKKLDIAVSTFQSSSSSKDGKPIIVVEWKVSISLVQILLFERLFDGYFDH